MANKTNSTVARLHLYLSDCHFALQIGDTSKKKSSHFVFTKSGQSISFTAISPYNHHLIQCAPNWIHLISVVCSVRVFLCVGRVCPINRSPLAELLTTIVINNIRQHVSFSEINLKFDFSMSSYCTVRFCSCTWQWKHEARWWNYQCQCFQLLISIIIIIHRFVGGPLFSLSLRVIFVKLKQNEQQR